MTSEILVNTIQVMAPLVRAPSHYMKQCGLIIKLINKVSWHLSRMVGVFSECRCSSCSSLLSSNNSFLFVMVVNWYLLLSSLIPLSTQGKTVPCPCAIGDYTTGTTQTVMLGGIPPSNQHGHVTPLIEEFDPGVNDWRMGL